MTNGQSIEGKKKTTNNCVEIGALERKKISFKLRDLGQSHSLFFSIYILKIIHTLQDRSTCVYTKYLAHWWTYGKS